MSDFTNITMGVGTMTVNGVDVGYLHSATVTVSDEIKEFFFGVPKVRAGIIPIKTDFKIKPVLAEFSAANLQYALGGLTPVTVAAAEVNKTASFEALTASTTGCGSLYRSKMGPTAHMSEFVSISTGADKPVIKNVAEAVTYVENDDYLVDYDRGYVIWNAAGTNVASLVADGYVAHYKYKYTPLASSRIDLGKTFTRGSWEVVFTHINPNTNKQVIFTIWLAQSQPELEFEFGDDDNIKVSPTFYATDDSTNHATNPYGTIYFEN